MAKKPTYEALKQRVSELQNEAFERKRAEAALRESEEKYRFLAENVADMVWTLDLNLKTNYVTPSITTMLGFTPEERQNQSLDEMITPESKDKIFQLFQKEFQREKTEDLDPNRSITMDVEYYRKDGSIAWMENRVRMIRDPAGAVTGFLGVSRDISKRRAREKDIREKEEMLLQITHNIREIFWVRDIKTHKMLYLSPGFEDVFGMPRGTIYENPHAFLEAIHPDDVPRVMEAHERQMVEGKDSETEYRIIRPDGKFRWIRARTNTVKDEMGEKYRVTGIAEDITERKQAEEAFRTSRREWEDIFQAIGHPTLILDGDHRLVHANAATEKHTGKPEIDLIGKRCYEIFHNTDEPPERCPYDRMVNSAHLESMEMEMEALGGVFLVSCTPMMDEKGRVEKVIHIATDVTERKRAENVLRESEEKYRLFVETANEGVWAMDAAHRTTFVNQRMAEILGYTAEEMLGKPVEYFMFSEDFLDHDNKMAQRKKGRASSYERRFCRKDGREVWTQLSGTPILDSDGHFAGSYGLVTDITDRKRAEESLKFEKERAQQYLDVAGVILIAVDKDQKVTLINPKGCEILGYPQEDIIGKDWFENFLFSENVKEVKAVFDQIMSGNIEPVKYYENRVRTRDGDDRLVAWHNSILKDSHGNIIGLFSSGEDITEQKRAEAEQERLRSQLAQAQKMEAIGTLSGGIAHDFNNILGIILGNAELAMDDVPEWNPARQNLDEVKKGCLRAKDVVKQILSFSRKSEAVVQKPLNIGSLVTESIKLLRASIPTSIEIRRNVASDLHTILGDSTQIHQIVMNLCANAAHAMEDEGGILEITLENTEIHESAVSGYPDLDAGPHVRLRVSDTGAGIRPEVIDRIFDPYFTTKDVDKGTGLGLSVVHGIIESHHGKISVESETGKGTTFNMLFPAVEREGNEEPNAHQKLFSGRERILLVDDEESMVNLNRQRLERLGYHVRGMTNPVEALDLFRQDPNAFDLIITDMTMPQMTGDKLVQKILEISPPTPIILCTGYSDKITEENAQYLGIRKYIEKPIEKEVLARSVREVLDGK